MSENPTLYLASASPRRRELLSQLQCQYEVLVPNVDETRLIDESVVDYVSRLALSKAVTAWPMIPRMSDGALLITADTCIALDDDIIGKPDDLAHAQQILSRISGRWHDVYSAVAVIDTISYNELRERGVNNRFTLRSASSETLRISKTRVCFRTLSQHDIMAYCDTNEPIGKAGAYAIQGQAAAFIQEIQGSYSAVMGLPLFETAELLRLNGYAIMSAKDHDDHSQK